MAQFAHDFALFENTERVARKPKLQAVEGGAPQKNANRFVQLWSKFAKVLAWGMLIALALAVLQGGSGTGDDEVDAMIKEAGKLAALLRRKRFEAGALQLDMPEIRLITDEHGAPVDIEVETSDEAHQLVEEFMLIANESVAHALNAHQQPAIYRVHEAPDPAKLSELAQELKVYGIKAGTLATREELNAVMDKIEGHPDEDILMISDDGTMIRMAVDTISIYGRTTMGVRLMKLTEGSRVISIDCKVYR